MSTVDFLSKEGVATLWQTIKDYAVANELLAQPNGVATLDEFGKVLQIQLPDYILGQVLFGGTIDGNGVATLTTLFKNRYNLSVDTLDVDNLTAANYEGSYFIATANGVSGIAKTLDIVVGDWVISNGSEWTKIDNTDAVRTVLGLKGDIQAPDLRNAMLGKSGNQGSNLALGTIWMGNGDGTVVTHNTSAFARSILSGITENTMFSKLWADRATNDSNGKHIANTYMPFAGGTFTGDVTHNANLILANSKVIAGKDTDGSNVSLLSLNSSNQVVIGYGAHNKYDTLIYGKHIYAYGDIYGQKGVSAKGVADFGLSGGGGGGTAYTLNIVPSDSKVSIQLKGADGSSDTKEISIFSASQAGVVPKSNGTSSLLFGSGWRALQASDIPSLDWSKITSGKPTTISGYGITDAYTKSQIENGIFPDMRVGLADDLGDIEEPLDVEYTFQPTANPNEIRDGYAQIESLKGNSLVWNQFINLLRSSGLNGTTTNPTTNGFIYTAPASSLDKLIRSGKVFSNTAHVYLLRFDYTSNLPFNIQDQTGWGYLSAASVFTKYTIIGKMQNSVHDVVHWYLYSTTEVWNLEVRNCIAIDLTQMFGEGYEPTTVEEFERRCPKGMPMDYNEGEVIHFNGDIKSVGFNQWDEEWVNGYYRIYAASGAGNDGTFIGDSSYIATAKPMKVMPNTEYSVKSPYVICFGECDIYGNYTGKHYVVDSGSTFTTSPNCFFVLFYMDRAIANATYNNDICINLSDADKNGTYEPYTEFVRDLPTNLFDGGMKSAGTAYDEVYWDKAKRTNVKVQRFGKVDLGTLDWNYVATGATSFRSQGLQDAKRVDTFIVANIICSKYELGTAEQVYVGSKTISLYPTQVWICDTSFGSDTAAFKAAMSGVMLYYELAEPIVEEIDIPYMDYEVSNDGTEQVISDTPTTPIKARVVYNFDAVGTIRQNRFDISTLKGYIPNGIANQAHKLATPRTIWGQSFDGSGNVDGDIKTTGEVFLNNNRSIRMKGTDGTDYNVLFKSGTDLNIGYDSPVIRFGSSKMFISPSGNVGIGTVDPQFKLDVNGSFRATSGEIDSASPNPFKINSTSTNTVELMLSHKSSNKLGLVWDTNNGVYLYSYVNNKYLGIKDNGTPYFYDNGSKTLLHAGNTALTLDAAYNWEDKNSQTNKQVYGFTLNVNGKEIGMSAITKEELEAILV